MPRAISAYYYDQLGSAFSDQPKDGSLWDLARFVEEVEQVRVALRLDSSNFSHSWGGLLATEDALKYQGTSAPRWTNIQPFARRRGSRTAATSSFNRASEDCSSSTWSAATTRIRTTAAI